MSDDGYPDCALSLILSVKEAGLALARGTWRAHIHLVIAPAYVAGEHNQLARQQSTDPEGKKGLRSVLQNGVKPKESGRAYVREQYSDY